MIKQGQQAYGIGQQPYLPKLRDLEIERNKLIQFRCYTPSNYKTYVSYHKDIQSKVNVLNNQIRQQEMIDNGFNFVSTKNE